MNITFWLSAMAPIIILLFLLIVLRWGSAAAAPVAVGAAVVVALVLFRTSSEVLAVAVGKGVWDAVFILYVIWPALLLYRIADNAGAFDSLSRGIERFSRNKLFLILAFGWIFSSFLQGVAGFGTPIAVVAPLMLAVGVRPIYAVVIPLIGHAWANMFGTIAVSWLATQQVVQIQNELKTALETAALLWIPNLAAGFSIAWIYGRMAAVGRSVPMVLIISLVHGGLQVLLMFWSPVLSNFLAGTAAMVCLYPLSRLKRYREDAPDIREKSTILSEEEKGREAQPVMGFADSLVPYAILTVVSVSILLVPAFKDFGERYDVGFPFPRVETGYGLEQEAKSPYSPFTPLTHPGTFLLISSILTWGYYRFREYYREWADRKDDIPGIFSGMASAAIPSSVAVIGFLAMSKIMDHSGQVVILAEGVAVTTPPLVYSYFANFIGILGAFMTSSNTASNVLFMPLQMRVAELESLSESAIFAAQSTGGAIGNAVAPANAVLGTGTANIPGREGEVLKKTFPWAIAVAVLTGAATIALMIF